MKPYIMTVSDQPVPAGTSALDLLRDKARRSPAFCLRLKRLGLLIAHGRSVKLRGHPQRVAALETALRGFAARHPEREVITVGELLALPVSGSALRVTLHRPDGWPVSEYHVTRTGEQLFAVRCIDGVTRHLSPETLKALFAHSLFTLRVAPSSQAHSQAA